MITAILVIDIQTVYLEGYLVDIEDECVLIRTDDNQINKVCHVEGNLYDKVRIKVNTVQIVQSEFEFADLTVLKEANEYDKMIHQMTIEEKLGQMMIVRTPDNLSGQLDFNPGGYILFGNDVFNKTEDEVIELTSNLQNLKYGALIMVDEEGGKVSRISKALHENPYPSVQQLYQAGGWEAVSSNLHEKSRLLKLLGIHVNLNPVVDVCENPEAFIYERSLGKNAEETSEYARMAVNIQSEYGLMSCLKHFPGYGDNVDTHTGLSVDTKSLDEYRKKDFLPFSSGIESGAQMVMMSHIIMASVDQKKPASLSFSVHQLVREELMFDGLLITDDLTMDAIDEYCTDALVEAVIAGNDLLITTDPEVSISPLMGAVENNLISLNRIDESIARILKEKDKLGILRK